MMKKRNFYTLFHLVKLSASKILDKKKKIEFHNIRSHMPYFTDCHNFFVNFFPCCPKTIIFLPLEPFPGQFLQHIIATKHNLLQEERVQRCRGSRG